MQPWQLFDQSVIGIEPTFSRMDSVVCWKEDSSSQQISQIVSGLEVINDAAGRSVNFDSEYNESLTRTTKHTLGCITNTQNFCRIKTNLFKQYLIVFVFIKFRGFST